MAPSFHSNHLTALPVDPRSLCDMEVLAYTLIEIARIRCEQLPASEASGQAEPDRVELGRIHRDLGLAGYHAGSALDPAVRHQSLELAHGRCAAHPLTDPHTAVEAVYEGALAAVDTMAEVLTALDEATSDRGERAGGERNQIAEARLAHLHALSASVSLDSLLNALRTR
jgi:hypothetical protein